MISMDANVMSTIAAAHTVTSTAVRVVSPFDSDDVGGAR